MPGLKQAPGGEATTPQGDDAVLIQRGGTDFWIKQQNMSGGALGVNARNYGFAPSATASQNQTALQNAINDAAQKGAVIVWMPKGFYQVNGPIYLSYDADNNTEFLKDASGQGQIQLMGEGVPSNGLLGQDPISRPKGTILDFHNTTGACLEAKTTDTSNPIRALRLRNFGLRSRSSDWAIDFKGANTQSGFDKLGLFVLEDSGSGVRWHDSYLDSFRNCFIAGGSSQGVGMELSNPDVGGAGLLDITQVTLKGFDIGMKVGDLAQQNGAPSFTSLYSSQFIGNRIGLDIQFGASVFTHGSWWESNSERNVFCRGNSSFVDRSGKLGGASPSIACVQFGDDSQGGAVDPVGHGALYRSQIGTTSVGVRVEGNQNGWSVTCVGTALNTASSGVIAYSVHTGDAQFDVISPQWQDFGSAFATRYENQGNFGTIIDPDSGIYRYPNLPTSQPANTGELWNDGGTVKVS